MRSIVVILVVAAFGAAAPADRVVLRGLPGGYVSGDGATLPNDDALAVRGDRCVPRAIVSDSTGTARPVELAADHLAVRAYGERVGEDIARPPG